MSEELRARLQHLLHQIENHETRWERAEAHPAYGRFVRQNPALRQSIVRAHKVFAQFRKAVETDHPKLSEYLDELEESVHYLFRDMDRLYRALGLAVPTVRVLN